MSERHYGSDFEISNTRAERDAAVEHAEVCLARAVEAEAKANQAIELLLDRTTEHTGEMWLRTQQRDNAVTMALKLGEAVETLMSSTATAIGHMRHERQATAPAQISTSKDFDWNVAREAAKVMYVRCREAAYVSPEDTARHLQIVVEICAELNKVVAALKIR